VKETAILDSESRATPHSKPTISQNGIARNPNTVAKAYAELVRDGVLETQPGRGAFVAKKRNVFTKAERVRRLDEALETAVSAAVMLDFSSEEILARMRSKLDQFDSK